MGQTIFVHFLVPPMFGEIMFLPNLPPTPLVTPPPSECICDQSLNLKSLYGQPNPDAVSKGSCGDGACFIAFDVSILMVASVLPFISYHSIFVNSMVSLLYDAQVFFIFSGITSKQ